MQIKKQPVCRRLDIPKAPLLLGNLLGQAVSDQVADGEALQKLCEPIEDTEARRELISHVLKFVQVIHTDSVRHAYCFSMHWRLWELFTRICSGCNNIAKLLRSLVSHPCSRSAICAVGFYVAMCFLHMFLACATDLQLSVCRQRMDRTPQRHLAPQSLCSLQIS